MSTPAHERPSSIEALALSLFYGQRPDAKFMVMTAYLDESYGKEQPLAVAGVVANALAWGDYQRLLETLFLDARIDKFHAKDFRQRRPPYNKWPYERYAGFNSNFLSLAETYLDSGFLVYLHPKDYREIYAAPGLPRKVRTDTAYAICVRSFIYRVLMHYKDREQDWPIKFVLEAGHKHQNDADRVFHEIKSQESSKILGALVLETKENCPPLSVPDTLAHFGFRVLTGNELNDAAGLIPTGPSLPIVRVSKPFMRRVHVDRELLARYRLAALKPYVERMAFGKQTKRKKG